MKYIIRETFCSGILIFIRYNNEKCNTMQTQMKFQRSVSVAIGLLY